MGTGLSLWNYQLVGNTLELGGRINRVPGSQQWRSEKQAACAFVYSCGYVTAILLPRLLLRPASLVQY